MKAAVVFVVFVSFYLFSSVKLESPQPSLSPVENTPISTITNDKSGESPKTKRDAKGTCECAVFATKTPEPNAVPLISKFPINVECDDTGKSQCRELCVALAQAARDHASKTLCATIGHAYKLQPSIFSRVCKEDGYTFTNITAPEAYCCHDSVPLNCNDAKEV